MPVIAYRVTRKRQKFSKMPKVQAMLAAEMNREVKTYFIEKFETIVADWKHRPEFKARNFITVDAIWVNVFPSGTHKLIYTYVTKGTKAHPIPKSPKVRGALAFMWGGKGSYRPKTTTAPSWRGLGGVVGGKMFFAKQVQHPGTKARNFEAWVKKSSKKWFSRTMENAWRRIIRRL